MSPATNSREVDCVYELVIAELSDRLGLWRRLNPVAFIAVRSFVIKVNTSDRWLQLGVSSHGQLAANLLRYRNYFWRGVRRWIHTVKCVCLSHYRTNCRTVEIWKTCQGARFLSAGAVEILCTCSLKWTAMRHPGHRAAQLHLTTLRCKGDTEFCLFLCSSPSY